MLAAEATRSPRTLWVRAGRCAAGSCSEHLTGGCRCAPSGCLEELLLSPLGCVKGHRTALQLGNSNTFHNRAQQFSSCRSMTVSGQKVKRNVMKWVGLSFVSICCRCSHHPESGNPFYLHADICYYQSCGNGGPQKLKVQHGPPAQS